MHAVLEWRHPCLLESVGQDGSLHPRRVGAYRPNGLRERGDNVEVELVSKVDQLAAERVDVHFVEP